LQRAIELTISRIAEDVNGLIVADAAEDSTFVLNDRIFVRHKEKMVKIMLADLIYLEADRNYSHLFTKEKDYVLAVTLKAIEEKLPAKLFLRIHRSYIVNITHIDEVTEGNVRIAEHTIPMGAGMREILLKGLRTL
jgi:DNA-binding LytR/AlgR family response regulator